MPHLPLAALIGAYLVRFGTLSVQVYDAYRSPGFDMGIFDQGVWLLSRFHAPFVTIDGRDLFGDHTSFILLLVVPLYWLWPHAQTLLLLQTALLAGAAVPIYMFSRRLTGSTWMSTSVAAAYLLNPALQNGNLEQFHPEGFLPLGISLAVLAAFEWKPRLLLAAVIACLLVKEDAAVLVIPLGAWVWFRRDQRWGVGIMLGALAWMTFAFEVVIRSLLGTGSFYTGRLPPGDVSYPAGMAGYLSGGGRPFYMWQLAFSFGAVFAAAPEIAAIGTLTLVENIVSTFPYMHQIDYHYTLSLVAVLAMGTAFALARLGTNRRRMVATTLLLVCSLTSCILWGLAPFSRVGYALPGSKAVAAIDQDLKAVPPGAVVSASPQLVAHLDHRVRVYQWPTPFSAHFWDLYGQEGRRLPSASGVRYLVIPSYLSGADAAVFRSIRSQFRLIRSGGGVSVYSRS